MKPIFLFSPAAGMTPAMIRKMERAGFLPLPVESFDAVRVVEPVALASLDIIAKAALDTISSQPSHMDTIPAQFGRRVAKALGTLKQDSLPV